MQSVYSQQCWVFDKCVYKPVFLIPCSSIPLTLYFLGDFIIGYNPIPFLCNSMMNAAKHFAGSRKKCRLANSSIPSNLIFGRAFSIGFAIFYFLLSLSRHMLFKLLSPPYYLKKISPFSFNNALRLKICYVSCECPFSQRWQPHVSLFYMK